MSTAEQTAAGCHGKRGIASRQLADSILGQRGGSRTAYRCSACGLWHLGTTVRRAAKTPRHRLLEIREAESSSSESFV